CGRQQKLLVPPPGRSIPRRSSRRSALRSARAEDYSREIMKIDNFFAELKRRNVYKVAVAYAVVSWLLIQAASIFLPAFDAPPWVMKIFIIVIIFGFPVALVIAWAFEMTPEGMKRTENVSPDEVIPHWSKKKFAALIVGVAVIAAGLLAFQLLRSSRSTITATADAKSI